MSQERNGPCQRGSADELQRRARGAKQPADQCAVCLTFGAALPLKQRNGAMVVVGCQRGDLPAGARREHRAERNGAPTAARPATPPHLGDVRAEIDVAAPRNAPSCGTCGARSHPKREDLARAGRSHKLKEPVVCRVLRRRHVVDSWRARDKSQVSQTIRCAVPCSHSQRNNTPAGVTDASDSGKLALATKRGRGSGRRWEEHVMAERTAETAAASANIPGRGCGNGHTQRLRIRVLRQPG